MFLLCFNFGFRSNEIALLFIKFYRILCSIIILKARWQMHLSLFGVKDRV